MLWILWVCLFSVSVRIGCFAEDLTKPPAVKTFLGLFLYLLISKDCLVKSDSYSTLCRFFTLLDIRTCETSDSRYAFSWASTTCSTWFLNYFLWLVQLLRQASKISSANSESYIFLPDRAINCNFHAISIIIGWPILPLPLGSPKNWNRQIIAAI